MNCSVYKTEQHRVKGWGCPVELLQTVVALLVASQERAGVGVSQCSVEEG